jgi:hypothetical protein
MKGKKGKCIVKGPKRPKSVQRKSTGVEMLFWTKAMLMDVGTSKNFPEKF